MKKLILALVLIQSGFIFAQTKTVVTVNGEKVQINPNSIATADNGLTASSGNVQLGGALLKATTITTTSSSTLALAGLQTGTNTDNILVADSNGVLKWVTRASFVQAGDNLGNHTATQDLNMSAKNITAANNITATGKTTTNSLQISKGTDGSVPVAGYVATAADASGNVVWQAAPKQNIVPTDVGSVISIDGALVVAQEITAQMTANFVKTGAAGIIFPIGNIRNVIIDNKSKFTSSETANSFVVDADGTYLVTMNVQASSDNNAATNNQAIVLGIVDNATGQWVARVNDSYVNINALQTFTLITSIPMVAGHSYSFAVAGNFNVTIYSHSTGTTGSGPISYYSVKRLK